MKFSKELLEKAKEAKTAEELLAMATAENVELTAEDAEKAFAELNQSGELADEELDNVTGGGCGGKPTPNGYADSEDKVTYCFNVGDHALIPEGPITDIEVVIDARFPKYDALVYQPYYKVHQVGYEKQFEVAQYSLKIKT